MRLVFFLMSNTQWRTDWGFLKFLVGFSILQWCSCRDYINTNHFHRSHERCHCHHFCEGWMCKPCRRCWGVTRHGTGWNFILILGHQLRHEYWWIRYVFECFVGHSGNLVREVSTTSWVEFVYREEAFDVTSHGELFWVDSELHRQGDGYNWPTNLPTWAIH